MWVKKGDLVTVRFVKVGGAWMGLDWLRNFRLRVEDVKDCRCVVIVGCGRERGFGKGSICVEFRSGRRMVMGHRNVIRLIRKEVCHV